MSSPDVEALRRMAAGMGLGPDVVKQVRANTDKLRRLAEGVRASGSSGLSGIASPTSSTQTDMHDLLKQHADAARAVAEREKRLPPRHPPRKDRCEQLREMKAGRRQAMEVKGFGERGFQFSFIGMPKASSLARLSKLQPILFDEMQVTKTHEGRYLAVRIVSRPAVVVGITFLAEDVTGRTEVIAIYNLDLHGVHAGPDLDALFPLGTILVVREPTFKMNANGTMSLVRMDSPTDFEIVGPDHPLFSTLSFATPPPVSPRPDDFDFKALGNKYFVAKKDLLAVKAYTDGLAHTPSPQVRLLLRLNRSQAHLRLENYASAYHDSSFVLKQLDESAGEPPQARLKATIRLARAFEGMRHLDHALEQFGKVIELDAGSKEGIEGKERIERKLRERDTGVYDWRELEKLAETQTKLDIGDFIGSIKVVEMQERGGGRGVVATREIEAGEVLLVEKALCVGELPKRGRIVLLDFATETATDPSRLDLVANLGSTLVDDISLTPLIDGLYGGPDHPPKQSLSLAGLSDRPLPPVGEQAFIDIARLQAVTTTNAFGAGGASVERPAKPEDEPGSGLFLRASLPNHACLPNAMWTVLRDVMIESQRRPALARHLPDGCACDLCTNEALDKPSDVSGRKKLLAKRDDYRLSLKNFDWTCRNPFTALLGLRQELEAWIDQLESTYSEQRSRIRPELAAPYHLVAEASNPAEPSTRALAIKYELKSLEAVGCVIKQTSQRVDVLAAPFEGHPVPSLLCIASHWILPPADRRKARQWLKAAHEMSKICYGDDWSSFVERHARYIARFEIEGLVAECRPSQSSTSGERQAEARKAAGSSHARRVVAHS
ncbi:hypothetical protein JCM10296v2_005960 [Rhodotorula toruloides]